MKLKLKKAILRTIHVKQPVQEGLKRLAKMGDFIRDPKYFNQSRKMWNKEKKYMNKKDIKLSEGSIRQYIFEKADEILKEKLIAFFKENPSPSDEEFHSFAKSLGMEPDDLEQEAYSLLGSIVGKGVSNEKGSKPPIDPKELKMGIDVEKEHTTDNTLKTKIAMDHLSEPGNQKYYTKLKKYVEPKAH